VQRRNALDSSGLPPALLKAPPRQVRLNTSGGMMLVIAALLVAAGIWGGIELNKRAEIAGRQVGLFASERMVTAGEVVRLQKRGDGNDRRVTVHYTYMAAGRELAGATTARRSERERYVVGSPVAVWYLPSEPTANWLDGYAPQAEPGWPGTAVPFGCGVAALALIYIVRRQSNLLAYGRPAIATVTKVQKKRTDKGTIWVVHYEWTLMSGATRTGRYNHGRKQVPAVGDTITIIHDRDNTFRHSKYPMPFVSVKESGK
jgi:hypothetical protein